MKTVAELEEDIRKAGIVITLSGWVKEVDAARILGMHVGTLKRYIAAGRGPRHLKQNTRRRYMVAALVDWLNECEQTRAGRNTE